MSTNRKVVPLRGREKARPQSIYDKLEDARKKRAKALDAKAPANTPSPVRKPVLPIGERVEEVADARSPVAPKADPPARVAGVDQDLPFARPDVPAPEPRLARPSRTLIATLIAFLCVVGLLLLPRSDGPEIAAVPPDAPNVIADEPADTVAVRTPDENAGDVAVPLHVQSEVPETVPVMPDLPRPQTFTVGNLQNIDPGGASLPVLTGVTPVERGATPELSFLSADTGVSQLATQSAPRPVSRPAPRPVSDDPVVETLVDALEAGSLLEPAPALPDESGLFAGVEVYLHAPTGVAAADVEALRANLTGIGVPVIELRPTRFSISNSNVRYFNAGDETAARAIAEAAGAVLRDFTTFEPKPREGLIEVWVSGRPRVVPATAPAVQRRQAVVPASPPRVAGTTVPRDGGGSDISLGGILVDVAKTVEAGAKDAVKTVSSGIDTLRGKRKGQNR